MQATGGTVGLVAGSASIGSVGLNAGSNNIGSITNITGTMSLPTGAATAALQTTGNTALASLQTALGAAPMQSTGGSVALVAGTATIGSVKVTDGTNVGAVTAASTAAAAANPAQVVALSPNSPLPAGTNLIGSVTLGSGVTVGNGTSQIQVTPTVTAASAYVAGNVVGGLLTFANAVATPLSGVLESITIAVKSSQATSFKLYIFNAAPATTFTDKTAPAITTADAAKLIDVFPLANPDTGLGANVTLYSLAGIARSIVLSTTSLYAVLVAVSTPTFTTTTDVVVTVSVLKD